MFFILEQIFLFGENMKKAFTLIELLVVIAIIAILAAILFPVFAQAREKARQTNCLSNCKQIGTALQLYVDDYDETMPPMYDITLNARNIDANTYKGYPCYGNFAPLDWHNWVIVGDSWTWMDSIYPYVKNIKMFVCPSYAQKVSGYFISGYAYNLYISGIDPEVNLTNLKEGIKCTPVSLSAVKNPSELLFVGEAPILANSIYGSLYLTNHLLNALDNAGSGAVTSFRHNKGANFTMCDGHAKYYKRGQGPSISYYEYGYGKGKPFWDPAY